MSGFFSRSSFLPRLLNYTALPSSNCRHYSQFSNDRQRHIWISGLLDPYKLFALERMLLYKGFISYMRRLRYTIVERLKKIDYIPIDVNHSKELYVKEKFKHYLLDVGAYTKDGRDRRELYYAKYRIKHTFIRAGITSFEWMNDEYKFRVIDTHGRADDFTDEVETALRRFDSGAINVLCSIDGVQSHSITVNEKMIRYKLPRLIFINNLDHKGANPWQVLNQAKSKLYHRSAAIQVPIGLEDDFKGLVDLVKLKAYYFDDLNRVVVEEIPADMEALVSEKRRELVEVVAQVDDKLAEAFCRDMPISAADLEEAIRRATISRRFIPIFMGSAFKYTGLQLLLDGVVNYLPCPSNYALNQSKNGEKRTLVAISSRDKNYSQITYLRIVEGVIRKGDFITNANTGKTFEVPRLCGWCNDELEVIPEAHAGEEVVVCDRLIGDVDYATGHTFTCGLARYTINSDYVSESVSRDSAVQTDILAM